MKKYLILSMILLLLTACGNEEDINSVEKEDSKEDSVKDDDKSNEKDIISYLEIMEYLERLTAPYIELAEMMETDIDSIYEEVHKKHQELDDISLEVLEELKEEYDEEVGAVKKLIKLASTIQDMVNNKKDDMSHIVWYSEYVGEMVGDISRMYLNDNLPETTNRLLSEDGDETKKSKPDADFFLDESNQKLYSEKINKGKYKELKKEVEKYIDREEVVDSDYAHEIVESLEPVLEILDKVEINYDEFDKSTKIYYEDLNDISNQNFIVPFIENVPNVESNGDDIKVLIGFEKEGWLFADTATILVGEETYSFGSVKFETDTLGGSMIRESSVERWTDRKKDLIDEILDSEKEDVKIRFEGKKGNLDYTFTENDIKAIEVLNTIKEVNHDLANIYSEATEELDI